MNIAADALDTFIERVALGRLADRKILRALRATPDLAPLETELSELRRKRSNVTDLVGEGLISRRDARAKLEDLGHRIERVQSRLNSMRAESPLTDLAMSRSIPNRWRKLGVVERRRAIADLVLIITVNRGQRGKVFRDAEGNRTINPDRLEIDWLTADNTQ